MSLEMKKVLDVAGIGLVVLWLIGLVASIVVKNLDWRLNIGFLLLLLAYLLLKEYHPPQG